MELKRLFGDLERPVPLLVRDLIHQEPLLRVADLSKHPDANHERIGRFDTPGLTHLGCRGRSVGRFHGTW